MSLPKKTERTKFVIWLAKKSVCLCFPYKFVLLLSLRIKSKGSKSLFFSHQPLFTSPHLFGSPQSLLQLGPVVFMSKQHGSTLVKSHAKPNLPQIERPVIFVQDQPGWLWVGLHPLTEPVSHTSFSARVQNNFILYGSEFILWQRGFQLSSFFFFFLQFTGRLTAMLEFSSIVLTGAFYCEADYEDVLLSCEWTFTQVWIVTGAQGSVHTHLTLQSLSHRIWFIYLFFNF